MRTNVLSNALCAGLLLGAVTLSQAVPVTFQVNMGYQISLGTFVPGTDQVTVRGVFNGWTPSAPMTPSGGDANLYQLTLDIANPAGTIVDYKFVIGPDSYESSDNRYYTVPSNAATVGECYYNNQWAGGPEVSVTFSVNMSAQIGAGNFDPATDSVQVRGGFEAWTGTPLAPSAGNPSIYEATWTSGTYPPGSQFQFKYVFLKGGNANWESRGNVPYGNDHNRLLVLTSANQTVPTVYFSDVSGYPIKAAAAFSVDVRSRILTGGFDPATDQVWVRGNAMGWGSPLETQGFQLFQDTTRPGTYTNLYKMDNRLTGAVMEFKYTLWKPATSATTWEDTPNKTLVWDGTEPTTPDDYHLRSNSGFFNNESPNDMLTEDTVVTFRVNMTGAVGIGGTPVFNPGDPAYNWVSMNGPFRNNGSWGPWIGTLPWMYDNGLPPDAVADDMIYTETVTFPRGSSVRVVYKYGINGEDNEAPQQTDHVRYIRTLGNYVMPVDTFGVMTVEEDPGLVGIAQTSATQVTLSWNGRPGLRLQHAATLTEGAWTDVSGTDGASSSVQTLAPGNQFYRLAK